MPEETKTVLIAGISSELWLKVKVRCYENGEKIPSLVQRAIRRELAAGSKVKHEKGGSR